MIKTHFLHNSYKFCFYYLLTCEITLLAKIIVNIELMFFLGQNENEWNVVQNNTKYKQPNYQIDQSKLQGFKVISYYIKYLGYNLALILNTINFLRKSNLLQP